MDMSATDRAFQLAPVAFDTVRMRDAINPNFLTVVDGPVLVTNASEFAIRAVFVGADHAAANDVALNDWFQGALEAVRDRDSDDTAITLQHSEHNGLVRHASLMAFAASFATDESFVNFDMAFERPVAVRAGHQLAKFVRHAPSGFVGAANLALQFLRGDSVTGAGHQIHGEEPVGQLRAGLVEDGVSARVDVMTAFLTGECLAGCHGVELGLDATAGADKARPAELDVHEPDQTGGVIGELGLELLESIFHGPALTCCKDHTPPVTCRKGINADFLKGKDENRQ